VPVPSSPPHGHELSPADHELLRSAPPEQALRWVAAAVGRRARIGAVVALQGGTSSAVHSVDVDNETGRVRRLVLRRFVRADWLADEPDLPLHEAAALDAVATLAVPTPLLVAVDPDGGQAGEPAVLMTRLEGAIDWDPPDVNAFVRKLAEALPEIHAVTPPRATPIGPYKPYEPHVKVRPSCSIDPAVWRRAIEIFEGPAPAAEHCFIHRDYHPGNVLFNGSGGELTGVVDWVNASVGSPYADVGHCRVNLADRFGLAAADRFRDLHAEVSGRHDYDPYWDVVALLGGHDEDNVTPRDERFLAHALAGV